MKQDTPPLQKYSFINDLKYDSSLMICEMIGTLSKSMYNFINSEIVGKSLCNFLLHRPKDASISLCV